jgi:NAD(P)-dependent dehydrogenase (short-subunit alcohol dehydrogenase family)
MPLILKGSVKKVIALSTGMADIELIRNFDIDTAAPYTVSKAALNAVMAKFSAQYRSQGVLFLSISPGVVDTGMMERLTEEQKQGFANLGPKFAKYAPHFKGPITPEESANHVLSVIRNASVEKGDGGSFVSHFGNQQWL